MRISVMTSLGSSAVVQNPRKNSATGIWRMPDGPLTMIVAFAASRAPDKSDAESPWATEPPMVPRLRTCGSPTNAAAAEINGAYC